jgi:hypothetical protein
MLPARKNEIEESRSRETKHNARAYDPRILRVLSLIIAPLIAHPETNAEIAAKR